MWSSGVVCPVCPAVGRVFCEYLIRGENLHFTCKVPIGTISVMMFVILKWMCGIFMQFQPIWRRSLL